MGNRVPKRTIPDRTDRETFKKALELPQRCRTGRKVENVDTAAAGELFPDAGNKGVIVFSKKGDAFRFGFTSSRAVYMMDLNEKYEYWLITAQYDMETAEAMFNSGR